MTSPETYKKILEKAKAGGYSTDEFPAFYGLIFEHEFAKAFFGNDSVTDYVYPAIEGQYKTELIPKWKYCLKRMVVEEDPIAYLEAYLNA